MKFVVVCKTKSEVGKSKTHPGNWPAECEEFETKEAAELKYPGKRVFTVEEYTLYKEGLNHAFEGFEAMKKPWWKVWG